jgi:hypothetical protein
MKTAICYSGQPRYFNECFDNHKQMLFSNLEDFDIFYHFWYDKEAVEACSHMECGLPDSSRGKWQDGLINEIQKKLNPQLCIYQKPLKYNLNNNFLNLPIYPNPDFYVPRENMISMFYSIYKANLLKLIYEKEHNFIYDCVIRIRTDLFLTKQLDIKKEDLNAINLDKRAHTEYSLNDCVAYGSSELMDIYSNTIFNLIKCKDEGCIENSECFLGWNLKNINKNIKNIEYTLFREIKK